MFLPIQKPPHAVGAFRRRDEDVPGKALRFEVWRDNEWRRVSDTRQSADSAVNRIGPGVVSSLSIAAPEPVTERGPRSCFSRPRPATLKVLRRLSPLLAIFLTVFLDMLSFGTIIPDVQLRAERLVPTFPIPGLDAGLLIGITIAVYSLVQFVCAPWLGRLSDQRGRRVVLLFTSAAAIVGAVVYAFSHTLPHMMLARAIMGFSAANLGVAYAYVADSSTPEERGKSMGLIGMAFGLGFMFGPPAGSFLVKWGGGEPFLLGMVSAGLALVNLLFIFFFLPEVRNPSAKPSGTSVQRFQLMARAFRSPGLGVLLAMFFIANVAFVNLETTFFRLGEVVYRIDQTQTSLVLVVVGITGAAVQGGLIRVLMPRFGEIRLLRTAYLAQAPCLLAFPYVMPWFPLLAVSILLGIGSGLVQPSMTSLISKGAPPDLRGEIFGVTQSLGAIARMVMPIVANVLFQRHPAAPYWLAAGLFVFPAIAAWFVTMPTAEQDAEEAAPVVGH